MTRLRNRPERRASGARAAPASARAAERRAHETQLQLALDGAHAGVWSYEPASGRLEWDDRVNRLLGCAPGGEQTLDRFCACVHQDDRAHVRDVFERLSTGYDDQRWQVEFRAVWPTGRIVWLLALGCALMDDAGRVSQVTGLNFDITERKQADERQRQSQEALLAHARRLADRERDLRQCAASLALTEHRIRQELARLLHDELQQVLYGALLRADRLATRAPRDGRAWRDAVAALRADVQDAITQARSLAAELSPPLLGEGGLVTALQWLAESMKRRHGLEVEVSATVARDLRGGPVEVLIFDAVRELLFNVVKHSGVSKATVALASPGDMLVVDVSDAGRGCDPRRLSGMPGKDPAHGLGLRSIRDRLAIFGGDMMADSTPEVGTRVRVRVPRHAGMMPGASASASHSREPVSGRAAASGAP